MKNLSISGIVITALGVLGILLDVGAQAIETFDFCQPWGSERSC